MGVIDAMIAKLFASVSPHMRELGFEVVSVNDGVGVGRLPYREALIGDPLSGVLHGGVVTSLLDTVGGIAVLSAVGMPMPIATLDLRIDYLRPAEAGRTVVAKATCYHLSKNVGFTRAVAYHDDEHQPIATAAGTFMVATATGREAKKLHP
jgi:uncharacterized protein (TIGR00369 family)